VVLWARFHSFAYQEEMDKPQINGAQKEDPEKQGKIIISQGIVQTCWTSWSLALGLMDICIATGLEEHKSLLTFTKNKSAIKIKNGGGVNISFSKIQDKHKPHWDANHDHIVAGCWNWRCVPCHPPRF
jgi:hypothetical protein